MDGKRVMVVVRRRSETRRRAGGVRAGAGADDATETAYRV